ncbi:pilus assembly PilX N-terminal domain-containing protein [Halanaerobacter jeridensis]|uniref:Type 4 fimbrial biogenesis protein PilX N-terminal domain-containing protein n=1 Tax=Halanaerobacter jeridensis TaxID=706427 RepID=A0A938XSV7_9FIRM|nr:pilus assembly PilX N-terminal domain-containing protein [Halanaerobacter jeridensis]MBM7556893.1 hypothetical protein [Halanaerobacter jeridensis]
MWQEERGSVVAVALIVIAAFTTIIGGLSSVTISEMRSVRSEIEETKAFYAAEAGIEKAIYDLKEDNLDSGDWNKVESNHYEIADQTISASSGVNYSVTIKKLSGAEDVYEILATGNGNDLEKKIVTHVKYNDMFTKPITSGGTINSSFTLSGSEVEVDVYDQEGNKTDPKSREISADEIPDFNFDAQDHQNGLSDKYFADQTAFENSDYYSSSGWWIFKSDKVSLPAGEMIYLDSSLSMSYDEISSPDPNNPAVVVVNGNLDFGEINNDIENVYFLVNGNYTVAGAGLDTKNTLVYTTGNMNFNWDVNYNYQGALISKGDMSLIERNFASVTSTIISEFLGLDGSSIRAEKIQTDVFSHVLDKKSGLEPVMISWEEK